MVIPETPAISNGKSQYGLRVALANTYRYMPSLQAVDLPESQDEVPDQREMLPPNVH